MQRKIPLFLLERPNSNPRERPLRRVKPSFVSKGLEQVSSILRTGLIQWDTASRKGLLQSIDARVKVLFLIIFIVIVSLKKTIISEAAIGFFLMGLALASGLHITRHYRKILLLTFIFGFLLALPSALNIITPGEIVLPVLHLEKSHTLGSLTIPQDIGITGEGLWRVSILSLRLMNSLSISFLVLATTAFMEFIKALKVFRVPDVFMMIIILSYKYIFIFVNIVQDMHLAKKSRLLGPERDAEGRKWVAGRLAFMYHKSQQRCEEVIRAMIARGLSDSVKLSPMPKLKLRDRLACLGLLLTGIIFYWI